MELDITPYETCFRVSVDGKRTGVTIDFGPAGSMDVHEEAAETARCLQLIGYIPEDSLDDAIEQITQLLK